MKKSALQVKEPHAHQKCVAKGTIYFWDVINFMHEFVDEDAKYHQYSIPFIHLFNLGIPLGYELSGVRDFMWLITPGCDLELFEVVSLSPKIISLLSENNIHDFWNYLSWGNQETG